MTSLITRDQSLYTNSLETALNCRPELLGQTTTDESVNHQEPTNPMMKLVQDAPPIVKRFALSGDQLVNLPPDPMPFIVEGLIPKGSLIGLVGSSEAGKSTFARDFSFAIATGATEYLGRPLYATHKSIIYMSSEDSPEMMREFLEKRLNGRSPDCVKGFRLLQDGEGSPLPRICHELKIEPADLVVMDVFSDFFLGNINDTIAVRAFLNDYQKLANEFKTTFLFLHHTGKRTEKLAPSKNNTLGSQGFESKMRLLWELRPDGSDDFLKHLCILKGNYIAPKDKKESILLKLNPDDRSFTCLGKGVGLEKLAETSERKNLDGDEIREILSLHAQGKSCREISDLMKADGINVGKTKVSEIIKKHKGIEEPGAFISTRGI